MHPRADDANVAMVIVDIPADSFKIYEDEYFKNNMPRPGIEPGSESPQPSRISTTPPGLKKQVPL